MTVIRIGAAFLAAVVVAALLATAASTHFVLNGLEALGTDITVGQRINGILSDWVGMGPTYAGLLAAAFLIAFVAGAFVARLAPNLRWLVFAVAGAVAIVVMIWIMKQVLGVSPIGGARTGMGLAAQAAAGAVGGLVFHFIGQRWGRGAAA